MAIKQMVICNFIAFVQSAATWRTSAVTGNQWQNYCVIDEMLRDLFMMRRTSTSGRLSCLVWAHPSSATAMCRSKRSDTDFFRNFGFPLKNEPSHCFITLSIFSVLGQKGHEKRWSVFTFNYFSLTDSICCIWRYVQTFKLWFYGLDKCFPNHHESYSKWVVCVCEYNGVT